MTIKAKEISQFNQLAKNWWDPNGSSRMLHAMNRIRMRYILHQMSDVKKDVSILDAGSLIFISKVVVVEFYVNRLRGLVILLQAWMLQKIVFK